MNDFFACSNHLSTVRLGFFERPWRRQAPLQSPRTFLFQTSLQDISSPCVKACYNFLTVTYSTAISYKDV